MQCVEKKQVTTLAWRLASELQRGLVALSASCPAAFAIASGNRKSTGAEDSHRLRPNEQCTLLREACMQSDVDRLHYRTGAPMHTALGVHSDCTMHVFVSRRSTQSTAGIARASDERADEAATAGGAQRPTIKRLD